MDMRNCQILTGHLGQDPVVKTVKVKDADKKVTEGSIAYTPRGSEEPCWYNFEIWGDTPATLIGDLKAGDKLQISGAHVYTTGADGKRYYKIIAESFELMTPKAAEKKAAA